MRREEETVPVTYIDVDEDEERLILISLDPSSAMAFTDQEKLASLVAELPEDLRALTEVLRQERKVSRRTVVFETHEHFRLMVECASQAEQQSLLARLQAEGYACSVT